MPTVVTMRFKSHLPEDELRRLSEAGLDKFRALPGLSQKYYVQNPETKLSGGVYIFHTRQAAEDYVNGPIATTVKDRFGADGGVEIEILDVLYTLSD